ncbi:DUF6286 domain-containing protein [Streptomyces sp. NPDC006733]|uniref:DUF6286 domain-containing protein n=1 Tax=Streptomyces sp. NPDC006733 TaxID=3155460 RepID=UPI0034095A84
MTGNAVLTPPADAHLDAPPAPDAVACPPARHARRFWSARRVPAAVAALLLAAATGTLLVDLARVRAGHPAMAWRVDLAHHLATRPLTDGWITTGAAVAAALGLWLTVLAVTPGHRALLPMRRDDPAVRAGIDRSAAAWVLHESALQVSGVRTVSITVHRRRATAHVTSHFRELEAVRTDVGAALAQGLRQLALARPLRLRIRLRTTDKG